MYLPPNADQIESKVRSTKLTRNDKLKKTPLFEQVGKMDVERGARRMMLADMKSKSEQGGWWLG